MNRVLAICLDGYEASLLQEMMNRGDCPAFTALHERAARFHLEHGKALRTGLAGEHVATGLDPDAAHRWAAVHLDKKSYSIWQQGTRLQPFTEQLDVNSVVFDAPYFNLPACKRTLGVVNWGAHDPGVEFASLPRNVSTELLERFGTYPASRYIYGLPWASVAETKRMGEQLASATLLRGEVAEWLIGERLPDWQLALLTVSEAHSAIEGLWHGVDPSHPLHIAPSSGAACQGLHAVYRSIDHLVGRLSGKFPDAALIVFSMHGMGANTSDPASQLLLSELLYRDQFNRPWFERSGVPDPEIGQRVPMATDESWTQWVNAGFGRMRSPHSLPRRVVNRLLRGLGNSYVAGHPQVRAATARAGDRLPMNWMPATRYQPYWHRMRAFALPSYYDGRIRINLRGRERQGLVALDRYEQERDRLCAMLKACRDPITGRCVVADIERPCYPDPTGIDATQADLIIEWADAPTGLEHPKHGRIGPVPYRRTGGHRGPGFAWLANTGYQAGDYGCHSAFDVVPTLLDLLGKPADPTLSGQSLLNSFRVTEARQLS